MYSIWDLTRLKVCTIKIQFDSSLKSGFTHQPLRVLSAGFEVQKRFVLRQPVGLVEAWETAQTKKEAAEASRVKSVLGARPVEAV